MPDTIHRFSIGAFAGLVLSDGFTHGAAGRFFAGAAPGELEPALRAHGLADGRVASWFNPIVIDTGRNRVLLDTGVGEEASPEHGRLRRNLAAAGIAAATIDTVILTHAHADHIAGNTTAEGDPAFPNARYFIGRGEWEDWTAPQTLAEGSFHVPAIRTNLLGIRERIVLVEAETEIVPGIRVIAAPGHTRGQLAVVVQAARERLLYAADVYLHPLHVEHPEWFYHSDVDPARSARTRRSLAAFAVAEPTLVAAYHFAFPALGRITLEAGRPAWRPVPEASYRR